MGTNIRTAKGCRCSLSGIFDQYTGNRETVIAFSHPNHRSKPRLPKWVRNAKIRIESSMQQRWSKGTGSRGYIAITVGRLSEQHASASMQNDWYGMSMYVSAFSMMHALPYSHGRNIGLYRIESEWSLVLLAHVVKEEECLGDYYTSTMLPW